MKLNRVIMFLTIVTALITGPSAVTQISISTNVQASDWHKGLPKAMTGTWKTKHVKLKLTRSSKLFGQKTQYKYLGHHKYLVNTLPNGSKFAVNVTKHSMVINNVKYSKLIKMHKN